MRNGIGHTMKSLAKPFAIIEIVAVIICSFVYFDSPNFFLLFGGLIFALTSNLLLYAIGQIAEDIHFIRTQNDFAPESKTHDVTEKSETHAKQNGIKY